MYLKETKTKNGRVHLAITESYRQNGKLHTRTIENCGYLDELLNLYDDPIAYFKQRAQELSVAKKDQLKPVIIEAHMLERISKKTSDGILCLGVLPLSRVYHALKIDKFIAGRSTSQRFDYDANAIFRTLVYLRILSPDSKKASFESKHIIPERSDFTLDDVYRALTFFAKNEDKFKAHLDRAVAALKPRNTTRLYYDVTNYYFEVENEDELRRRGVSKEHRPNPIVQMGLMLDADGIPIDYEVFAGNTNDSLTMMPIMKKLRARHKGERVIVVADKGLNTSDNIAATIADGNGIIFSQSVRKAPAALKSWVLDETGYTANESNTFKIKSKQSYKTVTITGADGKRHKVDIPIKVVAFWSKDHFDRARYERAKVIEKSCAAIDRDEFAAAKAHSSIRYVKDIPAVKETGEVATHNYYLDEAKIAADEALDGYYCIITSETEMDNHEVIEAYRGLWRIEESFKVTKSTFDARPVYVSREDHIRSHFLVCYTALLILRLLQAELKWQYTAQQIVDDLSAMVGINEDKNLYLFCHRTELSDELGRVAGVDLTRRRYTRGEIKNLVAETKKF